MRKLVLLLLLSSCVPFVAEASTMAKRTPPPPRKVRDRFEPNPIAGPGLPMIASTWRGDQYTLPYNDGTKSWQDLLGWSLNMQSVQAAMQKMQERGYIRREDRDTSFAVLGATTVVISYEIPGVPITERQPVVIASTRAVQMADFGWMPVSIVGGMVATGDSTDLEVSDLPGEESFTVMWSTQPMPPNAAGRVLTEAEWQWLVQGVCSGSAAEFMAGAVATYTSMTPSEQSWWKGMVRESADGAFLGGLTFAGFLRGSGVCAGFCVGAIAGGIVNATQYVRDHPYPKQQP